MPELKMLRIASDLALDHPEDVDALLAVLRSRGYDAEPCDVERAWQGWSLDSRGVAWVPPGELPEDRAFEALMSEMEEAPARATLPYSEDIAPGNPLVARSKLTQAQRRALEAIEVSFRDNGHAPTLRGLSRLFGAEGHKLHFVRDVLRDLQDLGYLVVPARGPCRLTYAVPRRNREVAGA